MSEPRWTPGPWKPDGIAIVSDSGDVCYMGELPQCASDVAKQCHNCKYNAHLIAAAPELYEAGRKALRQLQAVINILDPAGESEAMIAAAELEAALAKARGEAACS